MKTKHLKRRGRKLSVLLSVALMLTLMISATATSFAISDGDTIRFTSHHVNPDAPIPTRVFQGGGLTGTCCQAGNEAAASGSATVRKLSNSSMTAKMAYYYGYQQGWLTNLNPYPGFNTVTYSLIMQSIMQASVQGIDAWTEIAGWEGYDAHTIEVVTDLYNSAGSLSNAPNTFEVFFCGPSDGSQNFVLWGKAPTGKVKMVKVSGNTDITG